MTPVTCVSQRNLLLCGAPLFRVPLLLTPSVSSRIEVVPGVDYGTLCLGGGSIGYLSVLYYLITIKFGDPNAYEIS